MEETKQENKMGTMPVKRLLLGMSLPMMVSMLVQALYNIVDSIFVAKLSEDALTAVTLAFPMQSLMIAMGSGTGVGVNALLSKALGEKDFRRADGAANTALLLSVACFVVMLLFGLFGARPFLESQTADAAIVADGTAYLRVCCCLSFGLFFQIMCERLLQSTGKTLYSMASQLTGAVINIILDPVLIFGLMGFPRLGVAGAALATVIGQCAAATTGLVMNVRRNTEIHLSLRSVLHPQASIIRTVYAVGIPSILMMAIGSLMTYAMNRILIVFSKTATAVFGVYFKLQSFVFMPVFGMNNGLTPILAYNYGARKRARISAALRFALLLALGIMLLGLAVFQLFPRQLLGLFNASGDMLAIGIPALRIISVHFPIAAVCIALISTFQAFSKGMYALVVSVLRQLVVLIPAAWVLSRVALSHAAATGSAPDPAYVWWAFPLAETLGLVVTVVLFLRLYRRVIQKL